MNSELRDKLNALSSGDYLALYEDCEDDRDNYVRPYSDLEMSDINRELRERDLIIRADDKGLQVVNILTVSSRS